MIDWNHLGPFLIAAVVLVIVPGPDMILILTLGSRYGRAAGLAAAAGVSAGLAIHVAIAIVGLAALLRRFPDFYTALRWAGVIYLIYLAITTLRSKVSTEVGEVTAESTANPVRSAFYSGVLTNVLNPKVILFNVAFLPQFTDPTKGNMSAQLALLGAVLVAIDFCIDGPIGYFAGTVGQRLRSSSAVGGRRLNRLAALVFVGLAGWLAVN